MRALFLHCSQNISKYTLLGYATSRGDQHMGHVAKEKIKLLNRIKRLRGQIEAIERAVTNDQECADVLQQATACRGALDGFIAEVIEDHIREHMMDPKAGRDDPRAAAAEELVDIVHQYLKNLHPPRLQGPRIPSARRRCPAARIL